MFEQLTDNERKALMYGVPAVAAVVLYQHISGKAPAAPADPTAPTDATASGSIAGYGVGSTDAIGTGQLADFETNVTGALSALTQTILDQEAKGATTPATAPRAYRRGSIHAGESANTAAIRLRHTGVQTTRDGRPLTGAYIVSVNHWGGSPTTIRKTGLSFVY